MRKSLKLTFLLIFLSLTLSAFSFAQATLSTQKKRQADPTQEQTVFDPVQNRLFWMSTGRTMPEGKFSVMDAEVFLLQLGYAPTKGAQLNFSYIISLDKDVNYWSLGAKFEVVQPSGFFHGLSLGADIGFFSKISDISSRQQTPHLYSMNVAGSLGGEIIQFHASLSASIVQSGNFGVFSTISQIGTDVLLSQFQGGGGLKLMGEILFSEIKDQLEPTFFIAGIRYFGSGFAVEIGLPFGKTLFSSDNTLKAYPIPYGSITVLF